MICKVITMDRRCCEGLNVKVKLCKDFIECGEWVKSLKLPYYSELITIENNIERKYEIFDGTITELR